MGNGNGGDPTGMSFRDILLEVRSDVKEVKEEVDSLQVSQAGMDQRYVTKLEFNLWQETQKTMRRWFIGTIIAAFSVGFAATGIIISIL